MNIWCSFQILNEVLRLVPGSMRLVLYGQHLHIVDDHRKKLWFVPQFVSESCCNALSVKSILKVYFCFCFVFHLILFVFCFSCFVWFGFVGLNRSLCKSILKLFCFMFYFFSFGLVLFDQIKALTVLTCIMLKLYFNVMYFDIKIPVQ